MWSNGEKRKLTISAPEITWSKATPAQTISRSKTSDGSRNVRDQNTSSRFTSSTSESPRVLRYDGEISRSGKDNRESFGGEITVHSLEDIDFKQEKNADHMILPAMFQRPLIGYNGSDIAEVVVGKMEDELIEVLACINPQIERIAMKGEVAYCDVGLSKMIPLNMFGSGFMRAASIISHCILGKSRILLIDELETGLHYGAIVPVLEALLKLSVLRNVQIFATSHSLDILKGLQQVLSSEGKETMRTNSMCYVLGKNKDGAVTPYEYGYTQFEHCIKNGIEIR